MATGNYGDSPAGCGAAAGTGASGRMAVTRPNARLCATVPPAIGEQRCPAIRSAPSASSTAARGDGTDVRLLWREYDGRVVVAVHDARTGDAFTVDVLPHDRATEVFGDPFAYAAAPGIPTSALEVELMMAAPLTA
jgi:hypothetical protein